MGKSYKHVVTLLITIACHIIMPQGVSAKDTFNVPLQYDILSLDPARFLDTDSIWVATQIYEGLFELTPKGNIAPRLLSSWQVSKDGKIYTFCLRENVKFSDGSLLTSKDVVYTISRLLLKSKRERSILELISGADEFISGKKKRIRGLIAIDDYKISVEFKTPLKNFPYIITSSSYFILPAKYKSDINKGTFFSSPIGTGPYKISKWNRGRSLTLTRNIHYWDGEPPIRELNFQFFDPEHPWTKNEIYQFDMLLAIPAYSRKTPPGFSSRWYHRPAVEFVGFNLRHPFWKNIDNRRALATIFDKKQYYRTVFRHRRKSWRLTDSIIPYGLLSSKTIPRNVQIPNKTTLEHVKKYLQKNVKNVYFASHDHLPIKRIDEALKRSFGPAINPDVKIALISPDALLPGAIKKDTGFFFMRLVADTFDPYEILVYFSEDTPEDFTGFKNSQFTDNLRKARQQLDPEERANTYARLSQLLDEHVVVIPIASMFNERLFIRTGCNLKDFGPLGPWYYRMSNITCR